MNERQEAFLARYGKPGETTFRALLRVRYDPAMSAQYDALAEAGDVPTLSSVKVSEVKVEGRGREHEEGEPGERAPAQARVTEITASRMKMARECGAKVGWYYLGYRSKPAAYFLYGDSFHDAFTGPEGYYTLKHAGETPPGKTQAIEIFDARVEAGSGEIEDWGDDSTEDMRRDARKAIPAMLGLAEGIYPHPDVPPESQLRVVLSSGVAFVGHPDVVEANHSVRDIKTAKRAWAKGEEHSQTQHYDYSWAVREATGKAPELCWYDVAPRTAERHPIQPVPVQIERAALDARPRLIQVTIDFINHGLRHGFIPNTAHRGCSHRYCAYAPLCEAEYGVRIKP